MKEWKVILATLVIFGTGVVTGGLLVHLTSQKPVRPRPLANQGTPLPPLRDTGKESRNPSLDQRKEYLSRLTRELQLSSEQLEKVEKILKDSQVRTKAVWESVQPRMQEEVRKTKEQIQGVLSDEQRRRFDEMAAPLPMSKEKRFEKGKQTNSPRASREGSASNAPANAPASTNQ